ncbi:MAG TPA: sulfatase-like hydrolase/transferase [Acidimicrobiales bacterium]|jgi:arylsulfatase A-like enzyme|nr:sulfatase-like hydrolase/transferase [Acidimicrobiales bacterium]
MAAHRNVLFVTVDQWRGDSLSALGHPVLTTPTLDRLAEAGILFANHWANAAPCGPSRACLYTGTYLHHNRSVNNGTPLDDRFTNVARLSRAAGYDPVLFGYTDTSLDPRTLPAGDPRLRSYEEVLPGFRPVLHEPWEGGSRQWGRWLAAQGVDVPPDPQDLYQPIPAFPGAEGHGSSWAPAQFSPEQSETAFMVEAVIDWLEKNADRPYFVHASFIRPHPPRRNPVGYHDLYDADDVPPFVGAATKAEEAAMHPLNQALMYLPLAGAPEDELERRQLRATYHGAQKEVDDQLARLFGYLDATGLSATTLVVFTSDHGEMGGDHWLFEKLGYWDESYHVPLIIRDPDPTADPSRGRVVQAFTESVDVLPTICRWLGIEVPAQCDGFGLQPFLTGEDLSDESVPKFWRSEAHWSWNFSNPASRLAERLFGLPMAQCRLDVERGAGVKYVQFAADTTVLPPLLFDLATDPGQLHDLASATSWASTGWAASERLARWRMRNEERTLSGTMLTSSHGMVVAHDEWR